MVRLPSAFSPYSGPCDLRLPREALAYRRSRGILTAQALGAINVTAWLYADAQGRQQVTVHENTPIAQIRAEFGPAATPDAEVGFHSEGHAAEWFRTHQRCTVLQIFTERIPCYECGSLLRRYLPGVPWYYYYAKHSWKDADGRRLLRVANALKTAYGL